MRKTAFIILFLFSVVYSGEFIFTSADSDTVAYNIGVITFWGDSGVVVFDTDTSAADTGRWIIPNWLAFLDSARLGLFGYAALDSLLSPYHFYQDTTDSMWYLRQANLDSIYLNELDDVSHLPYDAHYPMDMIWRSDVDSSWEFVVIGDVADSLEYILNVFRTDRAIFQDSALTMNDANGGLFLAGGTSSIDGATMAFFGDSHSSVPGNMQITYGGLTKALNSKFRVTQLKNYGAVEVIVADSANDVAFYRNVSLGGDLTVTGQDITLGATGVKISSDNDGALTLLGLGNGYDENLTINLDDGDENSAYISSTSGITKIDAGTIAWEGKHNANDGSVGANTVTGGLTFKDGLYISGTSISFGDSLSSYHFYENGGEWYIRQSNFDSLYLNELDDISHLPYDAHYPMDMIWRSDTDSSWEYVRIGEVVDSLDVLGLQTDLVNSAGLAAALSNETGTGYSVFSNLPTFDDSIKLGATGVLIYTDNDGAVMIKGMGDGYDENIRLNFDDADENSISVSSTSGVTKIDAGSIAWEGKHSSSDESAGANAVTGGLTFKDGLYISGALSSFNLKDSLSSYHFYEDGGEWYVRQSNFDSLYLNDLDDIAHLPYDAHYPMDMIWRSDSDETWEYVQIGEVIDSLDVLGLQTDLVNSAGLASALSDETGTDYVVFSNSPTFADDITIGATGVKITTDNDGALTFLGLGNGWDEDLKVNFDDGDENAVALTTTTGVTKIDAGTIAWEGKHNSSDGTAGASSSTGGLTFKDGLYTAGSITGDIESVTAGTGLTGGGTSGAITINAVASTGLETTADSIKVKLPASSGLTSKTVGLSLGTPSTLTNATSNSVTGSSHTHAVTGLAVDEAYSSANFNGGTTSAVSQDDFYDYNHIADTDDDGKIEIVDLGVSGFVKSDALGNLSVDTNTYLTGNQSITLSGDVTGSGSTSITTTIADNSVDGTDIALGSDAQGDIMYYDGTNWARLGYSTSGYVLKTQGASANPAWTNITAYESALEGVLDHDDLQGFVANEHIDWTNATNDLYTTGNIRGASIGTGTQWYGAMIDFSSYVNATTSYPIYKSGDDIRFNYDSNDFVVYMGTTFDLKDGAIDTNELNDTQLYKYIEDHSAASSFATKYKEYVIPASAIKIHTLNYPEYKQYSDWLLYLMEFEHAALDTEFVSTFVPMPQDWKEETDIYFTLHFIAPNTSTNDFKFVYNYRWTNDGAETARVPSSASITRTASLTANYHYADKTGSVSASGKYAGSMLHIILWRDFASASDNYDYPIWVEAIGVLYQTDNLGADSAPY